jgi:hypothetical protein
MVEPLLLHAVLIVIAAVTGRAEAEKDGVWIADIMVAVGCMKIHRIAFSCSSGCSLFPLRDTANLTPFPCSFLTSSG